MTYSKKSDCLDASATALDLEQLRLLKSGDRLILEEKRPGGSKEYIRGILHGIEGSATIFFLWIGCETKEGRRNCMVLSSACVDSSGKHKSLVGIEIQTYLDPDLETDREYYYPNNSSYRRGHNIPVIDVLEDLKRVLQNPHTPLPIALDEELPSLSPISLSSGWLIQGRSIRNIAWIDEFPESIQFPAIINTGQYLKLPNQEFINDNCAYNARSTHLKCAVNPTGSCDGCKDFAPIFVDRPQEFTIQLIHPILEGKLSAENIQELESIDPIEFFRTIELRGTGKELMISFDIDSDGELKVWTYLDTAIWTIKGSEISFLLSYKDSPRPWVGDCHSSKADIMVGIPVSAKKRFEAREIMERLSRML